MTASLRVSLGERGRTSGPDQRQQVTICGRIFTRGITPRQRGVTALPTQPFRLAYDVLFLFEHDPLCALPFVSVTSYHPQRAHASRDSGVRIAPPSDRKSASRLARKVPPESRGHLRHPSVKGAVCTSSASCGPRRSSSRKPRTGIPYMGVQWEGGAVDGGSII